MSIKNKIAILFLLISGGIFTSIFLANKKSAINTTHLVKYLNTDDHKLTDNFLPDGIKQDNFDALALFVVESEFCSGCISEIIEYVDVVSEYVESPLNRFNIKQHAIILGRDSSDYKKMKDIIQFPFSSSLVNSETEMAKKLDQWGKSVNGINQILIIDFRKNLIVGRIGIFTASTPRHFKKNLVQEAFYELEKPKP